MVFEMVTLRDGKETVVPEEEGARELESQPSEEVSSTIRSSEERFASLEKMVASLTTAVQQLVEQNRAQSHSPVPALGTSAVGDVVAALVPEIPARLSPTPAPTKVPTLSPHIAMLAAQF